MQHELFEMKMDWQTEVLLKDGAVCMEVLVRPASFAELICIQKAYAERFTVYRIMINTDVLILPCFIGGILKGFFWFVEILE